MKIDKLAGILITILLFSSATIGQQFSDVKQLELEDGLLDRIVNKVHRDTFGYFYLFFEQGIQQYDGKTFKNINSAQLINTDLGQISKVSNSADGGIYFEVNQKYFRIPPGTTKVLPTNKIQGTYSESDLLLKESKNKLSIANNTYTIENGCIWLESNNVIKKVFGEEITGLDCQAIYRDNKGNHIILLAHRPRTINKIYVIRKDGEIQDYSFILKYNDNIRDIFTEDIDSKWLVATFNGIFIFNFSFTGIKSFHVLPNLKKSDFGNIITSVNTDTKRTIFLKESYGLRELNDDGSLSLLFEDKADFFHNNQKIIYDQFNDDFYSYSYVAGSDFHLHHFNLDTEKVTRDYIPLRIRDLYNLDADHLLIGGHKQFTEKDDKSGSLFIYNKKNKKLEIIISEHPAIRNINFIKSTNEFWLGTQYGIFIYDTDFKLKKIINKDGDSIEESISYDEIRSMLEFHEYVIVGTYKGGIYIIDKNSKKVVRHISETNGLSDNAIAAMVHDDEDNVWVSTFNGITVFNDQLRIIQKFYEYNGLPNREFNTKSIAKDENGDLYLGTLNGLVKINPKKLLKREKTHGLHLSKLEVFTNNKSESFSDLNQPISVYNNYDSLRLEINHPDYYKYRFDNWSRSIIVDQQLDGKFRSHENIFNIGKLPTSEYDLSFSNATNGHEQILKIDLKRDLKKILSIAGLVLFFLALSYFFFRYRIQQLKNFEKEKTRINTKIAELELTALRSQMNPHFIFNALGSVQYFIQTEKTEKADAYLSNFAKLMRSILESSKSKFISLYDEVKLLDLYVGLEKMRFEKLFDFELIVDPEVDQENPIPPMIIQPFVENAINHGLYHLTERKGKLTIHFKHLSENKMQCFITDNGIGREEASKKQRANHKSRGLEIVKDRVQTINSQADIKVDITTKDLKDGNHALGTQIILNIEYEQ